MDNSHQIHHANLFTSDLYQFTCSYAYFISNKHQQQATFQVFFRKYPFGGQYVVLGGIRAVKEFLTNLQFTSPQQQYLKSTFPHIKQQYFDWLRATIKNGLRFKSFREGQIVFAKEPLITYTGPLGIVQLLQTPILNLMGFSSLVATNASRMAKAVQPKKCIEFGIRRAQGPDGALTASQFAYLGGFIGTSNIQASKILKIPCYGTMSHAYVTSFSHVNQLEDFQFHNIKFVKRALQIKEQLKIKSHDGELAAFIMFAKSFPNNFVTLIDTYSTIDSGLLNTVIVAKVMSQAGLSKFGVRLDSGDLTQQSIKCRQVWNKYFPEGPRLNILASDDLHEERLIQMQEKGNQIDVFAIGTNIATCKKQPALGLVCKLVELNNQPKMKFSQDVGKATYPANKSVYRVWTNDQDQAEFDVISLEGEQLKDKIMVVDPEKKNQLQQVTIFKIVLLNNEWSKVQPYDSLQKCREHFQDSKKSIKEGVLSIKNPKAHAVKMTQKYFNVLNETLSKNKVSKQKAEN